VVMNDLYPHSAAEVWEGPLSCSRRTPCLSFPWRTFFFGGGSGWIDVFPDHTPSFWLCFKL